MSKTRNLLTMLADGAPHLSAGLSTRRIVAYVLEMGYAQRASRHTLDITEAGREYLRCTPIPMTREQRLAADRERKTQKRRADGVPVRGTYKRRAAKRNDQMAQLRKTKVETTLRSVRFLPNSVWQLGGLHA